MTRRPTGRAKATATLDPSPRLGDADRALPEDRQPPRPDGRSTLGRRRSFRLRQRPHGFRAARPRPPARDELESFSLGADTAQGRDHPRMALSRNVWTNAFRLTSGRPLRSVISAMGRLLDGKNSRRGAPPSSGLKTGTGAPSGSGLSETTARSSSGRQVRNLGDAGPEHLDLARPGRALPPSTRMTSASGRGVRPGPGPRRTPPAPGPPSRPARSWPRPSAPARLTPRVLPFVSAEKPWGQPLTAGPKPRPWSSR